MFKVIFSTLKRIHASYLRNKRKLCWNKQVHFFKNQKAMINSKELLLDGYSIIVAPHSDDEWIGASTIIQNERVIIVNMDMRGNDSVDLHKTRIGEMKNVAREFHKDFYSFEAHKEEQFLLLVNRIRPSRIFVPFFIDWHDEHLETISIVQRALSRVEDKVLQKIKICMYQVSVPIPFSYINEHVIMTKKNQTFKWSRFFKFYKTQEFLSTDRFKANEKINGHCLADYAAEVFSTFDYYAWSDLLARYRLNDIQKKELNDSVPDLKKIRIVVERIINEQNEKCTNANNV